MRVLLSLDDTKVPSTSAPQLPSSHPASGNTNPRHSFPSCRNVLLLLVRREVSSQTKQSSKRLGGGFSKVSCASLGPEVVHDPRRGLLSWVEAESLQHLSAKYCRLSPPPRSTIAAAFSPDGKMVASTHGDHTVKIIDYQTGSCLKVLSGHRRTPWVVRFHPYYPDILASGSLDHEVRLWDTNTADCIGSRDFYRPIASIAFHAHGELLAIASGHKLYMWRYNRRGETSSPNIVLKTRRSLRAVNFHPYAGPFLLTAEVNDLDSSDSSMALATTQGYLQYPPPTIYVTRPHSSACPSLVDELPVMSLPLLIWPSFSGDGEKIYLHHISGDADSSSMQPRVHPSSVRLLTYPTPSGQYELLLSPVEPNRSSLAQRETADGSLMNETDDMVPHSATGIRDNMNVQLADRSNQLSPFDNPTHSELPSSQGWLVEPIQAAHTLDPVHVLGHENTSAVGEMMNEMDDTVPHSATGIRDNMNEQLGDRSNQLSPFDNPTYLELPSSQGWLVEHIQAAHSLDPVHVLGHENTSAVGEMENLMGSTGIGQSQGVEVSTSRHHGSSLPHLGPAVAVGESDVLSNISRDESDPQHLVGRIQSDLANSLAAAAELPCTVKLRIWSHDMKDPCAPLDPARCCLTIPYAVLCSEMGAHFSPCGRFLAACVACMLPNLEPDPGLQSHIHTDSTEAATSPTRHPISAHQVLYELRVYSLEEATFGSVLASRAIRAAHCLTSIQFSPTSEHLLLAYGRRHSSLLKSVVIDGGTTIPIYTVLEVYRVSDMELVRVLPSAEDEVNVACFHPSVGGGLVYGTKEGKLRILEYDNSHGMSSTASLSSDEHVLEVQTHALEC